MRARPFIPANEQPRPFSEILAERHVFDPVARSIEAALTQVFELEGAAQAATDPAERKRLQCEAEEIRAAIADQPGRK